MLLLGIASAMDDPALSDAEYREKSRVLLAPWKAGARRPRNTRAAQVRERLAANARRVRPLLKSLIPLRLQGTAGDRVSAALRVLELCYRDDCLCLYD